MWVLNILLRVARLTRRLCQYAACCINFSQSCNSKLLVHISYSCLTARVSHKSFVRSVFIEFGIVEFLICSFPTFS